LTLKVLVTGGAGFIGSAFIRRFLAAGEGEIVNVDCLTYAANLGRLSGVAQDRRYTFVNADIRDGERMSEVMATTRPHAIMHFAAESHVDRSIDSPAIFLQTNVLGTGALLEAAVRYWTGTAAGSGSDFRFLHVSTDEVYGDLGDTGAFDETSPYRPSSPYAASKAASDHLARAWQRTYGLPVIVTNTCNNYGPYQFPEKLIPLAILRARLGKSIPLYGDGSNVRDWIHVDDHADALITVLKRGRVGETYAISANETHNNRSVVEGICDAIDALAGSTETSARRLIEFVADRPGHDYRYALDPAKVMHEFGWRPSRSFADGLKQTVDWYLANEAWWRDILAGGYEAERLGLQARAAAAR
jgi:dTDP-glucose 4,6-dehydratase